MWRNPEYRPTELSVLRRNPEISASPIPPRSFERTSFGNNLAATKLAMRDGLEGVAEYVSTMASVFFYLPAVLPWLSTILVSAAIAWRILRWAARRSIALPKPASL
jgi:hypothetical protein